MSAAGQDLRLLVAIDGSDGSERAAAFVATHLAGCAEVLAISVSPVPVPYHPTVGWGIVRPWAVAPGMAATAEEIDRRTDELRADGARTIESSAIEPDAEIVELGDPTERILAAARQHDVGLIVLGASEDGLLARLLHGSTASEVLGAHEFPVLVVP